MKKTFALILILVLVLGMTACGGSSGEADKGGASGAKIPEHPLDGSLGLSDSVLDGQLAIEGVVYQMPIAMSQLTENGWSYDFGDETLEPGAFGMVHFSKGELSFNAKVMNDFAEAKTVAECHVASMTFGPQTSDTKAYYADGGKLINVQFSSSVNISTGEKDLIAALGESDSASFLTWRGDNAKYISPGVSFSVTYNDDGSLNQMTVEYLPADFQP